MSIGNGQTENLLCSLKERQNQRTRRAVSLCLCDIDRQTLHTCSGAGFPTAVGLGTAGAKWAGHMDTDKCGSDHIHHLSLGPCSEGHTGLSAKLPKKQILNLSLVKHLTESA